MTKNSTKKVTKIMMDRQESYMVDLGSLCTLDTLPLSVGLLPVLFPMDNLYCLFSWPYKNTSLTYIVQEVSLLLCPVFGVQFTCKEGVFLSGGVTWI